MAKTIAFFFQCLLVSELNQAQPRFIFFVGAKLSTDDFPDWSVFNGDSVSGTLVSISIGRLCGADRSWHLHWLVSSL